MRARNVTMWDRPDAHQDEIKHMRINSKGQVTIPQAIREQLGLLPGTEVQIAIDGNAVKLRKHRKTASRGGQLVARLRGKATTRLSTDQILALTRSGR